MKRTTEIKKLFALILAVTCLLSVQATAYASDNADSDIIYDVLVGSVSRSTKLPTQEAASLHYDATIEELGNKWLYTNVYFTNIRSISCSFEIGFKRLQTFVINCYDMTDEKWVGDDYEYCMDYRDEYLDPPEFIEDTVVFSGLNTSHRYAIAFREINSAKYHYLQGSCSINASR